MSGSKSRPSPTERALASLQDVRENPHSPESREKLKAALAVPQALVVARAAHLIAEHQLEGFAHDLDAAFPCFIVDDAKLDPSCQAKIAILEALDRTESQDPAPFLLAIRVHQPEAAWGPPVDTAGRVRGRGILALARIGHDDLGVLAADLLSDADTAVRQSAAEAIEAGGNRAHAGILKLKLSVGDEEPAVTLACLAGLLTLAPEHGLPVAAKYLEGDASRSELAAVALGQSPREDALTLLLDFLKSARSPTSRALAIRCLGYHRSERALAELLRLVADGARADATAAVKALSPRAFDSRLRGRVEEAAGRNRRVDLGAVIAEIFGA